MNTQAQPPIANQAPVADVTDILTKNLAIDFADGARSPPRRRVGKRPDHPDADLIEHCIEYGMQLAAARAAHGIDPTDAKFAAYRDDVARARADRAMAAILELEPATIDGVRAKAALVELSIEDWELGLDEIRQAFLISLANDVVRLHRHARGVKSNLEIIVVPR